MYINELVLEITRRCNIQCRHCMRGEAQSKNMSNETMRKALTGITSIGTVTFTGGEPSLAVDRIRYFTECIHMMGIDVGEFYVVTNGKIASKSLKDALTRLAWHCGNMDDEVGGLVISEDQYHRELGYDVENARMLYQELPFFHDGDRRRSIEMPLNQGRALKNGLGVRDESLNPVVVGINDDGSVQCSEGTVYINVKGDVIPSCDLSYENQDLEKVGNVWEQPLSEILKQFIGPKLEPEWLQEVA